MDKKLWIASIAVLAALLLELVSLLELYDLIDLQWRSSQIVASFLKLLALIVFCSHFAVPNISKPVIVLLAAIIIHAVVPDYAAPISRLVVGEYPGPVLLWFSVFGIVAITQGAVALAWIVVGSHLLLTKHQNKFNGYASVLGTAALIVSVFEVLVFLKTPKLLGQLCFSIGFLGLLVSLYAPRFALAYRRRSIFYTVTLGIPSVLYVVPVAFAVGGFVLKAGSGAVSLNDFREAVGVDSAHINTVVDWNDLLDESLTNYETQSTFHLFNDYWLFADNRHMAVNNTGVFEKRAPDEEWKRVFRSTDSAVMEYIHFDKAGNRGVIGLGYGGIAYSEDGGGTWTQPDLFKVFEDLSGSEFVDNHLNDYSKVFLDPDTGQGSFVMGCQFFSSDNFARSWVMSTVTSNEGETNCLYDSPFAMDENLGLAITTAYSADFMMTRVSKTGQTHWEPLCVFDSETDSVEEARLCLDEGVLTDSQRQFVEKVNNQNINKQIDMNEEVLDQIMEGEAVASEKYQDALRDNGKLQWLSGRGYLFVSKGEGAFSVDHRVPDIDRIYPIDDTRAFGSGDMHNNFYRTADRGHTWQKIKAGDWYNVIQAHSNDEGVVYYSEETSFIRLNDTKTEVLLSISEDEGIARVISSQDGMKLLLEISSQSFYWYSSDSGENWSQHKIPYPAAVLNKYGDEEIPDLTSMDCIFERDLDECVAVYHYGKVFSWKPADSTEFSVLPDVTLNEDGWTHGEIALLDDEPAKEPTLLYLQADYQSLLQVLRNDTWETVSLPAGIVNVYNRDYTPKRNKILFHTEDGDTLIIGSTGEHSLFSHVDWYDGQKQCLDESGAQVIMHNSDGHVAFSHDSATNWLTTKEALYYRVACGVSQQWLWLLGESLTIHARKQ